MEEKKQSEKNKLGDLQQVIKELKIQFSEIERLRNEYQERLDECEAEKKKVAQKIEELRAKFE